MLTARNIENTLKKKGSAKKAKASAWFFKTKKGEYGYGDVFYGVTVPEEWRVARKYCDVPLAELQKLFNHKVHECRLTALFILVDQYKRAGNLEKKKIVSFYLKNTKRINNWDLVDSSAPYILGDYLINHSLAGGKKILYKLAKSKNMWERRIAIIASGAFIQISEFTHVLAISEILLNDKEDLLHKACGWMLREVGKKDIRVLEKFLSQNTSIMPRTMLRYAIEKFPEQKRRRYMALGKTAY